MEPYWSPRLKRQRVTIFNRLQILCWTFRRKGTASPTHRALQTQPPSSSVRGIHLCLTTTQTLSHLSLALAPFLLQGCRPRIPQAPSSPDSLCFSYFCSFPAWWWVCVMVYLVAQLEGCRVCLLFVCLFVCFCLFVCLLWQGGGRVKWRIQNQNELVQSLQN